MAGGRIFVNTLSTKLRRSGVHPKVVSDILGHKKVNLAMDLYDRTDVQELVQPLSLVVGRSALELIIRLGKNSQSRLLVFDGGHRICVLREHR